MHIQGTIKSILYSDKNTGYTVAALDMRDQKSVTIVGSIADPREGEVLRLDGDWVNHRKFGRQFQFNTYMPLAPTQEKDILSYLKSGLIVGIGPQLAKRIVDKFGAETFSIIQDNHERLGEISGIGKKRIKKIAESFAARQHIQQIMYFLKTHGVATSHAVKIYKTYQAEAIAVLRTNPYRLIKDIHGIGFKTADQIAVAIGYDKDSPLRIEAGVLHTLDLSMTIGHVYLEKQALVEKACSLLEISQESSIEKTLLKLNNRRIDRDIEKKHGRHYDPQSLIVIEKSEGRPDRVYDEVLHKTETGLTEALIALTGAFKKRIIGVDFGIEQIERQMGIRLAPRQKEAVACACEQKCVCITGGPGTGKTTIIKAIAEIFHNQHAKVLLCAPTGRAAKRMQEASGYDAKTIHRLLEFSYERGFQRNRENPLECDLIIVDETSMVDIRLMYNLIKAIPDNAVLVLVGDANQLPAIGPGNVLKDLIDSRRVAVIELDHIFRQAAASKIVTTAHKILNGNMPDMQPPAREDDFWFLERTDAEQIQKTIIYLLTQRFTQNTLNTCQVLTPMHNGPLGTAVINDLLQAALNPNPIVIERGTRRFKIGDKVMQVKNSYEREVYNGDIGLITEIDAEFEILTVHFDGRPVEYGFDELNEIQLAFCCTIHKSQGCEFPVVIIPIVKAHFIMLARNLIYTAITRGKQKVVLIGEKKAVGMAVRNDRVIQRNSGLGERLSLQCRSVS